MELDCPIPAGLSKKTVLGLFNLASTDTESGIWTIHLSSACSSVMKSLQLKFTETGKETTYV